MGDVYMALISSGTIAPGASATVAHGLVLRGVAVIPDWVQPASPTTIAVVGTPTATDVVFRNDGPTSTSMTFLATLVYPVQAREGTQPRRTKAQLSLPMYYRGSTSSGTGGTAYLGSTGQETLDSASLAERVLTSISIPAGQQNAVGKVLSFIGSVRDTATDGAVTVRIRIRLGGLTGALIADFGAKLPAGTDKTLFFALNLRTITTGAAGTVNGWGMSQATAFAAGQNAQLNVLLPAATVDLTAATDLTVTAEFSAVTVPTTDNAIINDGLTASLA